MFKIILSILLSMPPSHHDTETDAERKQRLSVVAQSIVVASEGDAEVAAFLIMTGDKETKLARHIHEGRCKSYECDGGMAATLWQVWRLESMSEEHWESMQGSNLEATTAAARYAARLYRMKSNYCRSPIGGISAYATGRCFSKDYEKNARARHREMRKWQARLSP